MKSTEDMSQNELLFMLIYHLLEKDYHENAIIVHKKEISHIQDLLNANIDDSID
jgi:hypothetical protein